MGDLPALSLVEGGGPDPDRSDPGPVLTPAELAARWHVTTDQVRRLAGAGVIPGFRLGSYWRFNLDEIVAWERNR